jgi:hypothetical protein
MDILRAQSIVGDRKDGRPMDDFYPTPPEAVKALLRVEKFYGSIWEPACGDGAISKYLLSVSYPVISSDLYDHGYGQTGIDFLQVANERASNIITNPPFNLASEFIIHAHLLGIYKFAFLMKLAALEGAYRSAIMEETGLTHVWVFRKRLTMTRRGEPSRNGGMIAFAWFVWVSGNADRPQLGWI